MNDIAKDHGDVKYTSQLFLSRSWICAPKNPCTNWPEPLVSNSGLLHWAP